jgi:translocation and assembly module TamB
VATPPGLWLCAKTASALVAALTPFSLHLSGVSGVLPVALRIGRVDILDQSGPWLTIDDLALRADFQEILKGHIRLRHLTSGHVHWDRRPIMEKRWRIPQIPGLGHCPAVGAICIKQLSLGEAVFGRPVDMTVNGGIQQSLSGGGLEIALTARRIDGKTGTLEIAYEQNGQAPNFEAQLEDSEILPLWLGLDSSVILDVSGSGPRKDWRGKVHGTTDNRTLLDGTLQFSGEFPTVITASLDTNIGPSRRLQALERLLGPDTHFSLHGLLGKAGLLEIRDLSASSPRGIIEGAGTLFIPEKTFNLGFQGGHADLALLSCKEEGSGPYLPASISATVTGDASRIDIRLAAFNRAAPFLQIETSVLPDTPVQIDGTATVFNAPLIAGIPATALLGDSTAIAWSAQYMAPGLLTLSSFAADNPTVQFHATGSVLFPSASADLAYGGVLHNERIPPLAGYSQTGQGIPFTGTIRDGITTPTISITASGLSAAEGEFQFRDGTLNLDFHLGQSGTARTVENGSLHLASPQCNYGDSSALTASCAAGIESQDFDRFTFRGIDLRIPAVAGRLSADATYTRATGTAGLMGKFSIDDLSASSALYPHTLSGTLSGALRLEKNRSADPVRLGADLDWNHPSGLPEGLIKAAGDKMHAAVHLESAEERLTLNDAHLELEAGTITASGWLNKGDRHFKLLLDTKAVDLARVVNARNFQGPGGFLDMKTRLEGALDDFSLAGDARIMDLSWERLAVRSTKLKFTAEHLPANPEGTASLSSTNGKKGLSLEGSLAYQFPANRLHVKRAKFSSGKNHIEGELDYILDTGELSTSAEFAFPALKELSALLSLDLSGTAQGKVTASQKGGRLDLTLRGKAEKLNTPYGALGALDANLSIADMLRKPKGDAAIAASALSINGLELSRADITMSGDGVSAFAKTTMAGRYQKGASSQPLPFTIKTTAKASFEHQNLSFTEFSGDISDTAFSLTAPALLQHSGTEYGLDNMALQVGKGGGELAVHYSTSGINAALRWRDFPLSVAALAYPGPVDGTATGSLLVEGPLQGPTCRLEMQLAKVRNTAFDHGPGVDASIKAVHENQWTTAEIATTLSDAAKAAGSIRVPVDFSLSPPHFGLREQDELQADAKISADLAASAALMEWTDDMPRGDVTGQFRLSGTMATPKVSGEMGLENGGYENLRYGAAIKNLRIRLTADGSTVRIDEFSGTDGESGRLSATGRLEVSFAKRHPFQVDVALDRMRSLRTEYGTAALSGKLRFAGSASDATLDGAITVHGGDFRLPDRLNSSRTPKIEFTEKNSMDETPPPAQAVAVASAMPAMALDLSVSIPGRFFLRAPVLETEWNGDLHLRGTLRDPRTEGSLRVARGYLDLIGQRFSLADSTVGFPKGDIRAPYLNMTGVCMANDITARIQLSGPPSDAQLTLSSDPPLPQDEILSKLLFRKGVSQASPLQAIQVARTAAMFSDTLSLPQFLTGSVKLPGLDLFDIRTGEKVDKTVVGVGKYINDKIYVEAEQGASTDSGRVSAQVEVTPRVSVKADVGARNRGGVGILWKKDY